MFSAQWLRLTCRLLLLAVCPASFAGDGPQTNSGSTAQAIASAAPAPSPLTEAVTLYRQGDFDGAIRKYQQVLQENPQAVGAYAGMTRVYLKSKNVQQASETVTKALQLSDAPELHVARGEVYFRQGRIHDAEQEWVNVINSGHQEARAYLGLARVRWAISMYKSGWLMIDKAHSLDPSDPEIQKLWTAKLSPADRIKFLEAYLAGQNNEDAETRSSLQHYLEYLKARAKDARAACHLVSKASATETSLVRLLHDAQHLRGYGLSVDINGHPTKLLLDTGASGILINRNLAEKAAVKRLSGTEIRGVGDKGGKEGYTGIADSLKIGGLEFQGCTVRVIEQGAVVDEDGLIGADVFSSFLVDLDFPNEKMRLTELPKRPQDDAKTLTLKTGEDEAEPESQEDREANPPKEAKPAPSGPQDRYIAPEMMSYTPVYRFGHMLLVPTSIGEVSGKLFLLDSGAFTNHITPAAAREVTKVHGNSRMTVKGISGSVKDVYSADKMILQFGHLRQQNQDMLAFDLTRISDNVGTEISGTLGFTLLRLLDIKIDYRDGLIDFAYDPKHWGR